jgi:3-hydroxyisobutyrate dehydrogenase
VFANAKEGTYIADSSTISPIAAKDFAEQSKKHGLRYIDCPMSGGIMGAHNGTLTFMVGTDNDQEFERVSIVLNGMGKKLFKCGGPGTGEIAKIANNMILGIQMIAASEGMALGEKLGIDPKVLMEVLSVSTSSCWSITTANPRPGNIPTNPASKNYEGGFQTSLIKKDLALALEIANEVNASVSFGEKAIEYFSTLEKKGYGSKDFGIVYQYIYKNQKM